MSDKSGRPDAPNDLDREQDRLAEWRGRVLADLKTARSPSSKRRAVRNEQEWARAAKAFLRDNRDALIARYAEMLDGDIRECEEILRDA